VLTALKLGLTGGIGSGKSTVAALLGASGAAVVDADAIARELTGPDGLAMPMIVAAFGAEFMTPEGALEREKMRTLAYANASDRQRLEAIMHPLIRQETQRLAALAQAQQRQCIVFDIPLLIESATWRQQVDRVLVVDCTAEVQISRVMARNQLRRDEVEKIISTQASRQRRLGAADAVIFNVGLSLEALADEIRQISHHFGLSSATL